VLYAAVGVIVGLTGGLGNALVTVNLAQLQGSLGLYANEIAWLPTAYAMTFVSCSLILIKLRIEYGARPFALIFTALYAAVTLAHLLVGGFAMAIAVRAASGIAAAALNTLTLQYIFQAAPPKWRVKSIAIGVGIPLLALPLARLFSTELLALGEWRALYNFELGLALISLAAVLLMPLPPSERHPTFEPLDFVSFPLLAAGLALLCAVLGLGRLDWWTDRAWLGWALAASVPLIIISLLIEHGRARPLLATRWLGSADIVRFMVVTLVYRIVSAEQTNGAVGLLNTMGLINDQLRPLFMLVLIGTALGVVVSAIWVRVDLTTPPIFLGIAVATVACLLDVGVTNLTRAPQFYVTQFLIAFATSVFLAPSLLFGLAHALTKGTGHIVSFVGVYGIMQTVGGLAGSALVQTYQVMREKVHSGAIVEHLTLADPMVADRVRQGASAMTATDPDASLATVKGVALLGRQATVEANVLAYDDVFMLVALIAAAATLYLAYVNAHRWYANHAMRRAVEVAA
jgi:MFS family permease